ncbi:MAG TPA: MMPL family transporter [Blastocatellia bacterium]|nr:MMPL family transporter [Blastocatellia bacterium]
MSRFIVGHSRAIIILVIVITVFFAFGLRRGLILDVSPLNLVAHGSQARADFESALKNFGPEDYLVIAVEADDIFAPESLERLRALQAQIESLDGMAEVLSLVNVPSARSVGGVVEIDRLIPRGPAAPGELAAARALATNDRLYVGNLVSPDARTAAINVLFRPELPTPARHLLTSRIYDLTWRAGFKSCYFAGDPFSQWRSTQAMQRDLRLFLPLTLLLVAGLLWLCFRSVVAVVLPLGTIGIGLVWVTGLMGYLDAHFTILALMQPTLMLAIGCSYMIHVVNQVGLVFERGAPEADRARLLREALGFINLPVVVSALTIIAGFISLAFTRIPAIRATGIYTAIGAVFTMILLLTFVPAVLMTLSSRTLAFRVGLTGSLVKLLEATGRWVTSHQTVLYLLTAVILVVSVVGMRRIRIDIDYFNFLKANSEPNVGLTEIGRRLSGAVSFSLVVEGRSPGAIEDAETLRQIAALQAAAEAQDVSAERGIDRTLSVVDFVKHLNRAYHDGDPQSGRIPSDHREIRELFSDRAQLRGFLSADGRVARILIRSNLRSSQSMGAAIAEMERWGRERLPEFRVYATGTFVLLNRTSDQIAGEQVRSLTIALVTIYLMLSILFRSLRVGMTALIPNLIPVLFFFGFMGWRGIALNLTTSLVASVVLGLAVDNSVQFIVRFRRQQRATPELRAAIIESMRLSGRPIIYANVALAATFAVFALSNFEPIGIFGLLSAVTIIGCLIEDLVLLPARLTSPVFRSLEKSEDYYSGN